MKKIPWKLVMLVAVLAVIVAVAGKFGIADRLKAFSGWVADQGFLGMAVFVAGYIVATILFFPCSLLTIGAGTAFGLVNGTIVVSIGSTIGASCAFLISRYVARDAVLRLTRKYPGFGAVDRAIGEEGGKIVGLLRLSPALPYNLSNYFYGLTAVRFGPYVLASWIGMLPGTVLYVYIGYIANAGGNSTAGTVFKGIGLAVTIVVTVMITRKARAAIRDYDATDVVSDEAEQTP
ncbi:MAG: TVP38/TMEM64 family protein [Lentisphaeria bacterium]|nr:TVP38/TMEM64 family protein [Lentisphaeria bacterium]MDP7741587.1 TVP38/TMEM64 family protein [Lentisphaeria bacterium]